ncbi:MAG TPA: hypothetical protein VNL72_00395 [Gammaproteobacteria bacterium]|nr:hypothetical protein [Gammaproteobacteria bacterium]
MTVTAQNVLPEADDLDYEKIRLVEQQASRTGTEVYWVNPPRKRK